jgi:hypothetical protein
MAPTALEIAEQALVYAEEGSRMRILAEAVLAQRDVVAAARRVEEADTAKPMGDLGAALDELYVALAAVVSGTPPPEEQQ